MKKIYISPYHDPYINQAIEHDLFHNTSSYVLMLYINAPCVVIGRNQNPWQEINIKEAKALNVDVLRRLSGGGTVYHDLGNINFSFMYDKSEHTVEDNFKIIIDAMNDLGIRLNVNKRNDLCYKDFKVSGNAFYNRGKRAMHHGTLLINADTSKLWRILNFDLDRFETRSVASVKSKVINLKEVKDITTDDVLKAVSYRFKGQNHIQGELPDDNRFKTWSWLYGETPPFTYKGQNNLTVKAGKIVKIDGEISQKMKFELEVKEVTHVSRKV